jgi:hypothetical protein
MIRRLMFVAAIILTGCDSPTEPTASVESYAAPFQVFSGASPPDFAGSWRGQYQLATCRAVSPAACKDASVRKDIALELTQAGTAVQGMLVLDVTRTAFQGVITSELGIAGTDANGVKVRLAPSSNGLGGYFVNDTTNGQLITMSKRSDVIVPLTRAN